MELDLDLLKKDWNKNDFKKYSQEELFQMTKKKSVSVAKWVFIIGILEILFWIVLGLILDKYTQPEIFFSPLDNIINVIDVFSQILPFLFIVMLIYLNYKIRTEEKPKSLMNKIFLMKRTIRWYIRLFLGQILLVAFLVIGYKIWENYQQEYLTGEIPLGEFIFANLFGLISVLAIFIPILLLLKWIYKKLVYGRMLKQLKENYDELSKMEE